MHQILNILVIWTILVILRQDFAYILLIVQGNMERPLEQTTGRYFQEMCKW